MSVRCVKLCVFAACLIPLGLLVWRAVMGDLTANPIEYITHRTGDWTLRFLLLTLAVTPLRKLMGWSQLASFRRMLGLFAFFYATLHFSTYLVLDFFFDFELILDDVIERRYVTAGFFGFVSLVPLAATSTKAMIRRLGGERWRSLHRLAYVAAVAGVVHYFWLVKIDVLPPLTYAVILAVLLGSRVWFRYTNHRVGRASATGRDRGVPTDADLAG